MGRGARLGSDSVERDATRRDPSSSHFGREGDARVVLSARGFEKRTLEP
jgi:hypothetical protein